jgi:hypothetical protein
VGDFLKEHRKGIWLSGVWVAAFFVVGYIVASFCYGQGTLAQGKVWQKVMLAIWVVLVPSWFLFDFYFLYDQKQDPFEEYKHSQVLSKNFWIAVGLLMTAICFGDEILKH